MRLEWAYELFLRCRQARIPFLFKQASHLSTEYGIDALARYVAEVEGRDYDPGDPLLREYPETDPPLLSFRELGQRFTDTEFVQIRKLDGRVVTKQE